MNLLDLLGDAAAIAANPIAGLAKVALDVAPDIASLFGNDAEKAVGKLADTVRAITGTDPDRLAEIFCAGLPLGYDLAALRAEPRLLERGPGSLVGTAHTATSGGEAHDPHPPNGGVTLIVE